MIRLWRHRRPFAIVVVAAAVLRPAAAAMPDQSAPAGGTAPPPGNAAEARAADAPDLSALRTALLTGTGRPGDLIAELKSVLADHPDSAEAHLLLGLAYRLVGPDMLAEAIAELRQALALDPTLAAGRFYLAQAYLDLNRPERAREELETAIAEMPQPSAQFLVLLAAAEHRLGEAARSLELARQVPASDPVSPQARYQAALALIALDRRTEAIAELEGLAAAGAPPLEVTAALGAAYLDEGRAADAIPLLDAAVQAAPGRPDLHVQLARALRLDGQLDDAEARLAQALPPGAPREASEFYQTVDADIRLETGLIRLAQDRLDEAEAALIAALDIRPDHGPTHRYLAELRLRQDRRGDAATHAGLAREAGETLPAALAALLDET